MHRIPRSGSVGPVKQAVILDAAAIQMASTASQAERSSIVILGATDRKLSRSTRRGDEARRGTIEEGNRSAAVGRGSASGYDENPQ